MSEVTRIFQHLGPGERQSAEELLPLVYSELRRLAAAKMAQEASGHTLQPTALVHEAWLRLVPTAEQNWNNREHFFRAAAEAMRRILVDRARERSAQKRGGKAQRTALGEEKLPAIAPDEQVLAVNDALDHLALRDASTAELIKLRYFVGLSMTEAAEALQLSLRSAERMWTFGKAWLRAHLEENPG